MKRALCGAILATASLVVSATTVYGQEPLPDTPRKFTSRSMSGPRVGMTIIPGQGELASKLEERGAGRVISQFGWHFEKAIVAPNNGPSFVIEFIPLVGGVEYGQFILGMTLALGVRTPDGYEFGVGPNLLFGGEKGMNSALVIAVGKMFDISGVGIPLNVALVTSPIGNRFAVMTGYAIN